MPARSDLPQVPPTGGAVQPPSVELSLPESGATLPQLPEPAVPKVEPPVVPAPDTGAVKDALPGVLP
jgi:hypothetical protein